MMHSTPYRTRIIDTQSWRNPKRTQNTRYHPSRPPALALGIAHHTDTLKLLPARRSLENPSQLQALPPVAGAVHSIPPPAYGNPRSQGQRAPSCRAQLPGFARHAAVAIRRGNPAQRSSPCACAGDVCCGMYKIRRISGPPARFFVGTPAGGQSQTGQNRMK